MKTIMGFGLILLLTAAFIGCSSTQGNANLRNANSNTGYVVSNSNVATPMPSYTPSPTANSSMNNNMRPVVNANVKATPITNINSAKNSNMNSNMSNKANGN